ncbi:MAG TPA: winged helix-turn-helix domain-containing protein [Methanocorpusculum sp.]|nr:winged helix-turn-helix domain-containing protein [Methanocorpusculum sp.]
MDKDKEIRIVEQGSDEARLISKAMASSTASELLDALSERPKTATELEAETGYPLPTIQYHMGNLLNAGLVQVSKIRYSEKGKPMKQYAAADTILVISPKQKPDEEVRPVLRKYGFTAAGFILGVAAVAAVSGNVLKRFTAPQTPDAAGLMTMTALHGDTAEMMEMTADSAVQNAAADAGAAMNTFANPLTASPAPAPLMPDAASWFDSLTETEKSAAIPAADAAQPLSDTISYTASAGDAAAFGDISSAGDAFSAILLSHIHLGLLIFLGISLLILAGLMIFELLRIKKSKSGKSSE